MTAPTDFFASFSTTDDALVLASVSSPAELELLNDWLKTHRKEHPDSSIEVLQLPEDGEPSPGVLASLVEELEADQDRLVVPVRVFWVPAGLPTRLKLVGLISGRDTYRPPEILQRRILRKDPSRARVVAGEPAKVSELRQQWSENTVAENPREFARFVLRRAVLAIERVELRLLGPEYKSPRLVKPEMLDSARFRQGLEQIPGATVEKAGEMLDELSTGWSRFSVDLIPTLGRAIFSRGFDPRIDYDRAEIESMRHALETHPAVLLFSHRSYLDGVIVPVAMQENRLPPVYTFAGINLSFGLMGPLFRHSGVIFIRRKLDDPLYKYVLRQYVGYIVEKRFNLNWSIEGTRSRTGKMLPPKLGLLSYVADAYLDGRSDDILLQPVSISFDQLHETAEYAAYARGGEKTPRDSSGSTASSRPRGTATTARSMSASRKRFRCASTSASRTARWPMTRRPNGSRCRRWLSRSHGASCGSPRSTPRVWFRRCCSPRVASRSRWNSCTTRCRTRWTTWNARTPR